MQELHRRVQDDVPLTPAESSAWMRWATHLPLKKRKKRRKRKLPKTSSHPTLRFAHRRQRHWYVHGWFCCCSAPHDVFPSFVLLVASRAVFLPVVDRHQMLRIMAGMDPKDCIALFGSGMCKARFTGDSAPRAVSLSLLLSGPDARHHCRYRPDGQLRGEILVDMVLCGSDCRNLRIFSSCSSSRSSTSPS